jgi:hypothetical protein
MNLAEDKNLDGLSGRLFALWTSGFTRRWHMNPAMSCFDDYNCSHQGRCAQLVISLFPDHSLALLRAAVTQDAPECRVGDLSRDMKDAGGSLVALHRAYEARVLFAMGFNQSLTLFDAKRLKLVDYLDAFLFVQLRHPAEVNRNGWPESRNVILSEAELLGCFESVNSMLKASAAGDFR